MENRIPDTVTTHLIGVLDNGLEGLTPQALSLIAWAAQRTGVPVRLSGRGEALGEAADSLREKGVDVSIRDNGPADRIVTGWATE